MSGECEYPEELRRRLWAIVAGTGRMAQPRRSDRVVIGTVDASALSWRICERLADEWMEEALQEHLAAAAYVRLSLSLLAAGAPEELIEDGYQAAADEGYHARLCLHLAGGYRGRELALARGGGFPAEPIEEDLAALALQVFENGCIGETLAALLAHERLQLATEPAVRAALGIIAVDEARHAELAWQVLVWLVCAGGQPVIDELETVIGRASWIPSESDAADPAWQWLLGADDEQRILAEHGRIDDHALHLLQTEGLEEIVVPCANLLLATAESGLFAEGEERTAVRARRR